MKRILFFILVTMRLCGAADESFWLYTEQQLQEILHRQQESIDSLIASPMNQAIVQRIAKTHAERPSAVSEAFRHRLLQAAKAHEGKPVSEHVLKENIQLITGMQPLSSSSIVREIAQKIKKQTDEKATVLQQADNESTALAKLLTLGQAIGVPNAFPTIGWVHYTKGPDTEQSVAECDTYKIHLMPKNYSLDFVYNLATALLHNSILKDTVSTSKYQYKHLGKTITQKEQIASRSGDVAPLIVLYTKGTEIAQKALNEIYKLFGNVEGSGVTPRFNAKVTDLIWVAQGNANNKLQSDQMIYEEPNRIYCASDESPNPNYLYHPATGEALTSDSPTPYYLRHRTTDEAPKSIYTLKKELNQENNQADYLRDIKDFIQNLSTARPKAD